MGSTPVSRALQATSYTQRATERGNTYNQTLCDAIDPYVGEYAGFLRQPLVGLRPRLQSVLYLESWVLHWAIGSRSTSRILTWQPSK